MAHILRAYLGAIVLVFATVSNAAAITPSIGEIKDSRTTGQFFAGLDLQLKLVGDEMGDVKGIRTQLSKAVDETGRDLINPEKLRGDFEEFNPGGWQGNVVTLSLKNPARKAAVIKELKGEIELFMPAKDPNSIIRVPNFLANAGKPIQAPALKSAGVEFIALNKAEYDKIQAKKKEEAKAEAVKQGLPPEAMDFFGGFMQVGDNDLSLEINDPNNKIVSYEIQDAKGNKISTQGSMSTGNTKVVSFGQPVPADAQLVIYVMTPAAVQVAALSFNDIALP